VRGLVAAAISITGRNLRGAHEEIDHGLEFAFFESEGSFISVSVREGDIPVHKHPSFGRVRRRCKVSLRFYAWNDDGARIKRVSVLREQSVWDGSRALPRRKKEIATKFFFLRFSRYEMGF
jgi:hypothetical protein